MSDAGLVLAEHQTTLEDVRAIGASTVYYGAMTCWWTTDPSHLYRHPSGLPCDPRGGVLFEEDDVKGFLDHAAANPSHYGRHGLRAFAAAYHGNVVVGKSGLPTCLRTWDEYNDVLDAAASQESR